MLDSEAAAEAHRYNICLARIENKTEAVVNERLRYRRTRVATAARGAPVRCGTSGMSPPKAVLSIL